jgi:outer membrane lipoprotein
MTIRHLYPLCLALLLGACASGPAFDTSQVDTSLTPRSAAAQMPANSGKSVMWGGVILSTTNLENRTRVEVLAYPLDRDQMPRRDRDPLGRFMLEKQGFLDPASYAEGRLLTGVGKLVRSQAGKVGDSDYEYPVIDADRLYLWPQDSEYNNRSNVHFGVGVGVGF